MPQPAAPLLATRRHTQTPSMFLRRVRQQNRLSFSWATCKAVCTVHFYFYYSTGIRSYIIAHGSNPSSCSRIDILNDIFFVEADLFQHYVNSHTSYFGQQRIFTYSRVWCMSDFIIVDPVYISETVQYWNTSVYTDSILLCTASSQNKLLDSAGWHYMW